MKKTFKNLLILSIFSANMLGLQADLQNDFASIYNTYNRNRCPNQRKKLFDNVNQRIRVYSLEGISSDEIKDKTSEIKRIENFDFSHIPSSKSKTRNYAASINKMISTFKQRTLVSLNTMQAKVEQDRLAKVEQDRLAEAEQNKQDRDTITELTRIKEILKSDEDSTNEDMQLLIKYLIGNLELNNDETIELFNETVDALRAKIEKDRGVVFENNEELTEAIIKATDGNALSAAIAGIITVSAIVAAVTVKVAKRFGRTTYEKRTYNETPSVSETKRTSRWARFKRIAGLTAKYTLNDIRTIAKKTVSVAVPVAAIAIALTMADNAFQASGNTCTNHLLTPVTNFVNSFGRAAVSGTVIGGRAIASGSLNILKYFGFYRNNPQFAVIATNLKESFNTVKNFASIEAHKVLNWNKETTMLPDILKVNPQTEMYRTSVIRALGKRENMSFSQEALDHVMTEYNDGMGYTVNLKEYINQ